MTYPDCLTAEPLTLACQNSDEIHRLVAYVIPAVALVVLLVAILVGLALGRR